MAYKHGSPLIDGSLPFRIASFMTFYTLWPLAQGINRMLHGIRYEDRKKLAGFSRAILVSNHTTLLDPVSVSGALLPHRTWHTLLEETVKTPILGTFIRLLGGVPLPPGRQGLRQMLAACKTAFRYRRFIHFYPEGDCYIYNQRIEAFKPGAFFIAAALDIPVIPMVSIFSEGPFKAHTWLGRSLPLKTIRILDAVYPARFIRRDAKGDLCGESIRDFAEAVRKIMQEAINDRGGSSAFYRGKMKRLKGIHHERS
ncbi:MAG: 1-acyl-sn-glycerol-3-phosphate acyltransferase [Treponema sp.]|jgi:1-acyl-sn-glycerol-3-phosphate acyltransferase|nr:1-acyl-sn-glycerol-3-phosphate acyltransferase [Treponema sp.]